MRWYSVVDDMRNLYPCKLLKDFSGKISHVRFAANSIELTELAIPEVGIPTNLNFQCVLGRPIAHSEWFFWNEQGLRVQTMKEHCLSEFRASKHSSLALQNISVSLSPHLSQSSMRIPGACLSPGVKSKVPSSLMISKELYTMAVLKHFLRRYS